MPAVRAHPPLFSYDLQQEAYTGSIPPFWCQSDEFGMGIHALDERSDFLPAPVTHDGGMRIKLPDIVCSLWMISPGQTIFGNMRIIPYTRISCSELSAIFGLDPSIPRSELEAPHANIVRWIRETTGLSRERVAQLLGVSRQSLFLWEQGNSITDKHRIRLLAVQDVLQRAADKYQTPEQIKTWLDTPHGTDGRTPAQLLETGEIDRARLHAVMTSAPHLAPVPSWVKRPNPDELRAEARLRRESQLRDEDEDIRREFGDLADGDENEPDVPLTQ